MTPDATTRTAPVQFATMTLPIAGLLLRSVHHPPRKMRATRMPVQGMSARETMVALRCRPGSAPPRIGRARH